MPVSDEEKTLVFVLQADPVFQDAVVVAKMQTAGRPHTAQDTFLRFDLTHAVTRLNLAME